jgi:hypothetical protein
MTPLLFVFCLSSCLRNSNNDKINSIFEKEFLEKIKLENAKSFDYQHDPLTSQQSYFVNNKLKYLTFRHGPEVGFIKCYVTFDLMTDSIEKYIERDVLPNFEKSGDNRKVFDSIFLFYPKKQLSEIYFNNKKIDTTYRQDIFEQQMPFIDKMKSSTQKAFNSRKY